MIISCPDCPAQFASRPGWTLLHAGDGSHVGEPPRRRSIHYAVSRFVKRILDPETWPLSATYAVALVISLALFGGAR